VPSLGKREGVVVEGETRSSKKSSWATTSKCKPTFPFWMPQEE
jgi:hypothetical protein